MKRILIALTIVFTLCMSLFGCGTKDGADYLFDAVDGAIDGFVKNKFMTFVTRDADTLSVTASVKDLSGLKDYGIELPGLSDISATMYIDAKNAAAAQSVSVKAEGERLDIALYENEGAVVIASPLFEEAYSIPFDELVEAAEDKYGIHLRELLSSVKNSGDMLKDIADVGERYSKTLRALIRENIGFEVVKDGKNVIVTFALTDKELSAILSALAEEIKADEELADLLAVYDADMDIADIADALPAAFGGRSFSADVELTVQKKNDIIVGADVQLSAYNTVLESNNLLGGLEYTYDADTGDFTLTVETAEGETGKIVLSGESGNKNEYTYTAEIYAYGEKEIEAALEITASEITVSGEDAYGTGFEATLSYRIDKKKLSLELLSIGSGMLSIDVEDYGIGFTVEKDVKIPTAPAKTTECGDIYELGEKVENALYEALYDRGLLGK